MNELDYLDIYKEKHTTRKRHKKGYNLTKAPIEKSKGNSQNSQKVTPLVNKGGNNSEENLQKKVTTPVNNSEENFEKKVKPSVKQEGDNPNGTPEKKETPQVSIQVSKINKDLSSCLDLSRISQISPDLQNKLRGEEEIKSISLENGVPKIDPFTKENDTQKGNTSQPQENTIKEIENNGPRKEQEPVRLNQSKDREESPLTFLKEKNIEVPLFLCKYLEAEESKVSNLNNLLAKDLRDYVNSKGYKVMSITKTEPGKNKDFRLATSNGDSLSVFNIKKSLGEGEESLYDVSLENYDIEKIAKFLSERINMKKVSKKIVKNNPYLNPIGDTKNEDNTENQSEENPEKVLGGIKYSLDLSWGKVLRESLIQKSRYNLREKISYTKGQKKGISINVRVTSEEGSKLEDDTLKSLLEEIIRTLNNEIEDLTSRGKINLKSSFVKSNQISARGVEGIKNKAVNALEGKNKTVPVTKVISIVLNNDRCSLKSTKDNEAQGILVIELTLEKVKKDHKVGKKVLGAASALASIGPGSQSWTTQYV